MPDPLIWQLLLQVFLIALNAIFACAEIAVISINDTKLSRMAEGGDKRAKRLANLTSQPARFLATIQVAITLSGLLGSAYAADNFASRLTDFAVSAGLKVSPTVLNSVSVFVITLILSYFTLIFGELVPKRVAMKKSEEIGLALSSLISFIAKICAPLVWLLTASSNAVLKLIGIDPEEHDDEVTEEEIRMMVDAGSEKGTIDKNEKTIIQNVFEFDDMTAAEIATHRTKVLTLWLEESDEEWADIIYNNRHTVYPVCDGSIDNIVCLLNAKDYFRQADKSRENIMKTCTFPAYFVPENMAADQLFAEMKSKKQRLAIVLDEYGGTLGIVTLNDLVAELVGSFDEDDMDIPIKCTGGVFKIMGETPIHDVFETLKLKPYEGEYETFGGFVLGGLGYIPDEGESFTFSFEGYEIQNPKIKDHRLYSAEVVKKKVPEKTEEE